MIDDNDVPGAGTGPDPDATEAEEFCPHPWFDLDFIHDDSGFGCSSCGESWVLDEPEVTAEAVVVVWNSAKEALHALGSRVEQLEDFIADRLDALRCQICDRWGQRSEMVPLGKIAACTDHVGDVVGGDDRVDGDALAPAGSWVKTLALTTTPIAERRWLWERNVMASPALARFCGDGDIAAVHRAVTLPEAVAERLGLPAQTSVMQIALNLARRLDIDAPGTRQGMAFLFGAVIESVKALRLFSMDHSGAPRPDHIEEMADEISDRITPRAGRTRAVLVVDLFGGEMEDGAVFEASMADDLIAMIGHRASELLLNLLSSPRG